MAILTDRPRPRPEAILIGTPTLGRVSCYWHESMMDLVQGHKPMNRAIMTRMVKGMEVGYARDCLVDYALALEEPHISHIFFTDDDVFFPPNALIRLLEHQLPIIGGLYYAKTAAKQPLMLGAETHGTIQSWEPGAIVPCWAHGMGCTLIERRVFEDIEPPWFRTMQGEFVSEREFRQETEDVHFCRKAREVGYQPTVDTGLLCLHYDYRSDQGYPLEEWEAYVTGKELVPA